MNEFSKLNRDEMRKITGGVPPVFVCNIDGGCAGTFYINGLPHVLFGRCTDQTTLGCACYREDQGSFRTEQCLVEVEES